MSPCSRREALRWGGIGLSTTLAGCMAGSPLHLNTVTLSNPERRTDYMETIFVFRRDARKFLTFWIVYHEGYHEQAHELPLNLGVWHHQTTHLDSLRYSLRPLWDPGQATVVLHPSDDYPQGVQVDRDRETGRITIAVPALGKYGRGTEELEPILQPTLAPQDVPATLPLKVTARLTLSEATNDLLSPTYRATVSTTVDIPANRPSEE